MKITENKVLCAALIFFAAFFVYANSITHNFHWEDDYLVKDNVHVRRLSNIPVFFKPGYINVYESGAGQRYRPLRTVTLALDYAFWGEDPRGYHLTNVLLHSGAAVLFWLFCLVLTGDGLFALLAALIFAVHPVHAESVVWVKNRTDLLCSLFYLAGASAFAAFLRRGGRALYAFSVFCLVPALLAKEMAATLPAALTAILVYFNMEGGRHWKEGWPRLVPYYALLAGYLLFREVNMPGGAGFQGGILQHAGLMASTAGEYFKLLLWPAGLSLDRVLPSGPAAVAAGLLALAFAAAVPALYAAKKRQGAFWLLLFWILYAPVSNLLFIEGRPLAEQRVYLPSAAFCAFLAWGACLAAEWNGRRYFKPVLAAVIVAALALGARAVYRNNDWRSEIGIWEKTVATSPSARSYNNLAVAMLRARRYPEVLKTAEESVKLDPDFIDAYNTLGAAYYELGLYDQAIVNFEKAVTLSGGRAYKSLMNLGTLYGFKGQDAKALKIYKNVLSVAPWMDSAYYNMGLLLTRLKRPGEAERAFAEAIALNPYHAQAHLMLARRLAAKGDAAGAARVYTGLLKADPTNAEAANSLAGGRD